MTEAAIQKRVMIEATRLGLRVFRNNVGVLMDRRGIPVNFGLCVGSSDLIGWGKKDGMAFFVAIEVKRPEGVEYLTKVKNGKTFIIEKKIPQGETTAEQENFLNEVSKAGGFACVIRDENNKIVGGESHVQL